eukprot:TRINITY_DN34827_c0_g1_i1.p1 TRINITY_DN34827_c0_g1~~TRINITY_DN34827_c0_g1_i1.p1  ORF type:complete len:183 (+),score=31.08 TRINITY_DN34827_c0_g1_i1:235-783(+)
MMLILVLQLAACIVRGVYVEDLIGCFWFAAVCVLGLYALIQNMRINNIAIWGCACCINVAFDVVSFCILVATGFIDLEEAATIARLATPLPQIIGALYAWHLWRDYQASNAKQEPMKAASPYGTEQSLAGYQDDARPGSMISFPDRFRSVYGTWYGSEGKDEVAAAGHGKADGKDESATMSV